MVSSAANTFSVLFWNILRVAMVSGSFFMQPKLFMILLIIFIQGSCSYLKDKDAGLGLKKVENKSKLMKLNGYFYTTDVATNSVENKEVFFLFRNGVFFSPGWFSDEQLREIDILLMKEPTRTHYRDIKWMWGLYQIEDSRIVIEKWNPASGGYSTIKMFGKIVNDSTIIMTRFLPLEATDTIETKLYYHFRSVRQKPDSTNNFIP
jgi:hypothetical protein